MPANPFDLPTGGFSGEATITDAAFKLDDKFTDNDGNMVCLLSITLDPEDGEHEAFDKLYTCGPGWEPGDKGAKAVFVDNPDDDSKNFNGGTKVGRLVKKIVELCPDVIRDRYADGDGIGSTDAAMFVGLRFNWADEVKPYQFKDSTGATVKGESALLLPVEFMGVIGGGSGGSGGSAAPAKKATKKAAKKAPAKKAPAPKAPEPEEEGFPATLADQAWAAYEACEGFDDWLEAVLQIDGVDAYIDYVTDASEEGDTLWNSMIARAEAG